MKTVKQIAETIGVTKQAVFKKIKTPPLSTEIEPFISKVDGMFMVSVDGEKLIKSAFKKKEQSTDSVNTMQIRLEVALQFAERENETLRKENARLIEQNDRLTEALISASKKRRWSLRLPWGKKHTS